MLPPVEVEYLLLLESVRSPVTCKKPDAVMFVDETAPRVVWPDTFKYPVARILVEDTDASDDWLEMLRVAP